MMHPKLRKLLDNNYKEYIYSYIEEPDHIIYNNQILLVMAEMYPEIFDEMLEPMDGPTGLENGLSFCATNHWYRTTIDGGLTPEDRRKILVPDAIKDIAMQIAYELKRTMETAFIKPYKLVYFNRAVNPDTFQPILHFRNRCAYITKMRYELIDGKLVRKDDEKEV